MSILSSKPLVQPRDDGLQLRYVLPWLLQSQALLTAVLLQLPAPSPYLLREGLPRPLPQRLVDCHIRL